MNYTLFLGAGASIELGFQGTVGFKNKLMSDQGTGDVLRCVLERSEHRDIENMLTDIESVISLADKRGCKLLQDAAECTNHGGKFFNLFNETINHYKSCRASIRAGVYDEYHWNSRANEKLKETYDDIFDVLRSNGDIHICTTNYDQAMEKYMNTPGNGLECFDGFSSDRDTNLHLFDPGSFDERPENEQNTKCCLYKMHGSLNWVPHGDYIRRREDNEEMTGDNFVIYPSLSPDKNKEYGKLPYKTMCEKFQERISKTDVFIVIGYSFHDDSINKEFQRFLERGNTRMFVISPSAQVDTKKLEPHISYNINITDSEAANWLNVWREQLVNYPTGSDLSTRDALREDLGRLSKMGHGNNFGVYNWIGEMSAANTCGLFQAIPGICHILDRAEGSENIRGG